MWRRLHELRHRCGIPIWMSLCALLCPSITLGWMGPSCGMIENRGQLAGAVRYYASTGGRTVYFTNDAVAIDLPMLRQSVWMRFEGASPLPRIEPRGERETRLHYFEGNHPDHWRSNIKVYDEIVYRDVWPGIDLRFRLETGGLRYESIAAPGADRSRARFHFEGADRVTPCADGSIRLDVQAAALVDVPASSEGAGGLLRWSGDDSGGLAGADPAAPSEPTGIPNNPNAIVWSTFIGGGDSDYGHGMTIDSHGNPVITGYSRSDDFPTTPGAYQRTHSGSYDVAVVKLNPAGSGILWATFLGGTEEDRAFTVVLDDADNPVVGGLTYSPDFPTTPWAYDRTLGGGRDAFVAKLNSTGSVLMWSTYLGGQSPDRIWDLVLDAQDRPIVAGETYSRDFPTTPGAFDTTVNLPPDGFLTKLDAAGSRLVWSTCLGGNADDQITRVVLGPGQILIVSGNTASSDFPTTPGVFDRTFHGSEDCFVTAFDPSGGSLLYSTFLGGSEEDMGNALAADSSGEVVVAGSTTSHDFPVTAGAYDTTHNGYKDIFVSRLDATASRLIWSTYVGGLAADEAFAVLLDRQACPVLTGSVESFDFPTTSDAFDRTYHGFGDAFLTRLDPTGSRLLWSSYLGGSDLDGGWEMTLSQTGNVIVTGPSRSPDFPTTNGAYDRTMNGVKDIFVTCFDGIGPTVSIDHPDNGQPASSHGLWLGALPNPFSGPLQVRIDLGRSAGSATLLALDGSGRVVARIRRGFQPAGTHRILWDGRDARGRPVPPGVYWLRLQTGGAIVQQKVVCVR